MLGLKTTLLLASAALAHASPLLAKRQCVDYCGNTCYYQSDIDNALNQGYSDYQSGNDPDDYPHQYEDYEGFSFPDPGPYYEFPILNSYQVYTGGSPGADRVIFTGSGQYEGLITHTGASSEDGFVQCSTS